MKKILILFCCLTALLHVGCAQKEPLPDPGIEAVDMGLSVKWGSFNVGASRPEDYGNYYAWGEVYPKSEYSISNYFFWVSVYQLLIKYCTESNRGFVDNKTVLEPMDDVASVLLGGDWRIPTDAEWAELADTANCTWSYTLRRGVNGYVVKSRKTRHSIFLPLGGGLSFALNTDDVGYYGRYWSSTLSEDTPLRAIYYTLPSINHSPAYRGATSRYRGCSVRPVSN